MSNKPKIDVKTEIPPIGDERVNQPGMKKHYEATQLLYHLGATAFSPEMSISLMLSAIMQELRDEVGDEAASEVFRAFADNLPTIAAMEESAKARKQ